LNDLLDSWNRKYFDGRLSPDVLKLMQDLPRQSAEVHAFVERVFGFMKRAKFRAEDFSLALGWAAGFMPSRILPGAWGGIIPPITIEGRHALIDQYLAANPWRRLDPGSTLLDLGCGFPPLTTVDTARKFPDCQIVGADPSFGRYIVYDEDDNYACFREDGTVRYFQPKMDLIQWEKLYRDPVATKARFTDLLQKLLPLDSNPNSGELRIIEEQGAKLIKNPLRQYEKSNLMFREGGIGTLQISDLDAVRCFNVLIYFDSGYRQKTLRWVAEILKPGGIFLCGMNWTRSTACRTSVYQKKNNSLVIREFAFSIENIRAIQFVSWFAIHDDDYETCLQAEAVSAIRSDSSFCRDFDKAMDELMTESGICPRNADGYLGGAPEGVAPAELERRFVAIVEELDSRGFADRAAAVLREAGYHAWRNCVGHVAISPRS
jgi:SAM-dependent methyltransferase